MGERGVEDKPNRWRWSRRNFQWESEFEYFGHTGYAKNPNLWEWRDHTHSERGFLKALSSV
jgi:hypothetical protein